jgi:MFS family permease
MNDKILCHLPFGLNKVFYGWWIVLACFTIGLYAGAIVFYGFTAFFDPLVQEFGWSYTQISFAMSLRGVEMSFLAPLIGFLVDHYGPRRLAIGGVITIGLGFLMLSMTWSLWMFYGSIILIAFGGGGCATVVFMRVVASWFQKKIGLALGILVSGFGASGFLLPGIVQLIDHFGWRTAVIILGVGMWVIGIPLVLVIRDTPEQYGLFPDGRETNLPAPALPGEKASVVHEVSFWVAVKHKAFLFLALSGAIQSMSLVAIVTHIMPYMNLLHIPRATAGLIAGSIPVLSIAGRFGFGWLSDIFDKRYIIAISFSLIGLGMFALCYVDVWWVMILFLVLFPLGLGGAITLRGSFLQEYFGRVAFGRLLGIVMGVSSVGGIIGPTFAGFIVDAAGSYYVAWISMGIVTCCTVPLLLSIRPVKRAV